ncbi:hypothetical protein N7495_004930, partial [Penicillium taxi]|uniref:uncharacterized protein n=1 Tax=Penicillium taxi TaxID=168475 RepID=UPI00254580BA
SRFNAPTMASLNSTTTMNQASDMTHAPVEKPSTPPTHILPSQLAQVYSYVHPVLLLALCAVRFEALVENPAQELRADLPWLALLQISYATVCLPPSGSIASETNATDGKSAPRSSSGPNVTLRPGKPGYRRKQHSWKNILNGVLVRLTPTLLSITLAFFIATPVLSILLVLFGAPLTTHNAETVLCAAHMAVLSSTALIYTQGLDKSVWREVWGFTRPADAVWGSALGTGLGAWLGAIPIPLDWDRPWQAFPITILLGAYLGYSLGSLISRTPFVYGRRIQFAPEDSTENSKKTN